VNFDDILNLAPEAIGRAVGIVVLIAIIVWMFSKWRKPTKR
jgi:low affinity Fe/Cu permease